MKALLITWLLGGLYLWANHIWPEAATAILLTAAGCGFVFGLGYVFYCAGDSLVILKDIENIQKDIRRISRENHELRMNIIRKDGIPRE